MTYTIHKLVPITKIRSSRTHAHLARKQDYHALKASIDGRYRRRQYESTPADKLLLRALKVQCRTDRKVQDANRPTGKEWRWEDQWL